MSSRKRSNSVQSSEASAHSEVATSPRRRVVRRTQSTEDNSDGSDSEQETRRSRLKKKSSQKRSSNPNQKSNSKRSNVPNHIKIGKSVFFEQPLPIITDDNDEVEYFDSRCICDQITSEHSSKKPLSSLILLNRIERFKKQQEFKRIQNKNDEQILLDIIEKEGLYTKKEIERNRNTNFEKSCDPSLTQEEKIQITKRLKEQHELFRRLEKRDRKHLIYQLRCVIPHISNEEALFALKLTNNIEEEAIIKLTDYAFLQQIRKEIALEYNPNPSLTVDHLVPLADKWNYEQDQISPESPSSVSDNETPSTSTSFISPNESSQRASAPSSISNSNSNRNNDEMSDEEEEDDKDDDDFVIKERKKPANKTSKSKQTKKSSTTTTTSKKSTKKSKQEESQSECEVEEEEEDEEISEIDEEIEEDDSKKKKRKRKTSSTISSSRLLLDDALSDVIKKDGWSKARIEAYEKINTNPNAYYYRFNEPGESQKNGKWSQKEKELFIKKLKDYIEETDNFQWGLFSKRIPGRVGYQCSNFYRTLLKSGDVKVDLVENCKNKGGSGGSTSKSNSTTTKKRKKPATPTRTKSKKKKVAEPSDDEDDEETHQNDNESVSSHTGSSSNNSKSDSESSDESSDDDSFENTRDILEDFIDPITLEQVKDPAISPYGHVLGYQTWLKVLNTEPKNTCPYTKQTLTKRNLVKLNFDNIEEFKSKIRNFN